MIKRKQTSKLIKLLIPSFLLCSCVNSHLQPTVGAAICTQPAAQTSELQAPPPPEKFFSRCIRQILQEPQIDSDCSTVLAGFVTPSVPVSVNPNTGK